MATLSHSESRRRYSWWWNSHINPKNSKWLQENLKDVDMKVKSMIKLLEEDADSFARRAEMYYKKRPELMKLVEEFYRAYRALAERYDHATGALRQAHRAMAEAFPNQIPLMLPDESPYGSNIDDVEPNTPETPPPGHPGHALFDPNDLKDTAGLPSDFHVFNTQGSYSKEAGLAISKNDLRKSNEIFAIAEGRARKGLDFNQEGEGYPNKGSNGLRGFQMVKEKHNSSNVIKDMQQDVSRLSTENQDLKSQIMETSDRVNDAENEIQTFKDTLSKLNSQKDADHHQYRLCLEKISSLESQLSNTQNGMKKLDDELVNKVHKLLSAEELIQSLRSELALLDKKAKMQDRELKAKQEELNELNIALQDKHQQCKQAEISLLSKEKQLSESQEELKFINLEIRNETNKLRDVEFRKEKLEEDIHKLRGENSSLKEENLQYDLTIKGLEEEISLLKDKRSKLEEEVEVHVMEKESLKQELFILQGDRNDLEKRIKDLLEEMEAANFASDTLKAAINELESEKIELKDNCKKMEAEKETLMEKLKDMDTISEENKILENSLSDGNAEIEVLKEKIAALNDSNESLKLEISTLVAEKDSLVSELEIITQNVENLSAKNAFLENELSYANSEVGSLKAKLKDFEYSCQFLKNQNSVLHTEKITLISQVESINLNLENLADKFAELHDNHSSLSRDSISQIKELQNLLELEKQEQKSLLESHKVKLASLENIIYLLQKENLLKEKNLEAEQNNLFCAMIEIFMLQTSLSEAHETNASLSLEGRKNLQAKERAEALVSQLEQEKLIQLGNISSLSRHHEKLTKQIHLLNNTLHADKYLNSLDQIQDEILLDSAIAEAKKLLNFISDVKCENQKVHLQVSVLVTLLRQVAMDMIGLRTEKFSLENELEIKTKKILLLEKKQVELNHREEVVQAEMKVLSVHLGNIQEAVQTSKCESVKLIEEKRTLSEELYNLWQNHNELEEEKVELCLEAMKLDYLCTFFKCLSAERSAELKCFSQDLASLHSNQSFLETEINRLNRELTVISSENTQLLKLMADLEEEHKKSLLHLEFDLNTTRSFYEELNNQSQNTRAQLSEKESQLLEANQKVESTQGEMAEMHMLLHALQLENNEAMQAREELVKMISMLSEVVAIKKEEISFLHESLETLQKDNDRLQTREKSLLSELDTQTNEFEISEGIIAALLADIQLLKGNVATCEEKVQDTIVEEEIRSMVEKQILTMELGLTKNYVDILKTKHNDLVEQNRGLMDIYPPKITSLSNAIACLEEVMPIMNAKSLENQNQIEDIASVPHHHCCNQLYEDWDNNISGVLELEKLIAKVEALQKAAVETRILLEEERLDSSSRLEAACIEVEELKMNALSQQPEIHSSSNKTSNLAYDRDVDDDAISIDKYGQVIKDITLDQVSSPLPHMNSSSSNVQSSKYVEIDDQLLEAAERDCNNKTWKVSPVVVGHAMDLMGEEKSEVSSSGLLAEELSVDKLQMSDGALTSQNDWKEVTEGLTSDALRLAGIMSNVEELKRKMESLQIQELPPIFGYDTIKAQLKEAEGTVLELIDANSNLISKAQDHSFFSETEIKSDGPGNNGRWRISEQATRASEKVVRLEFELQKIQYVLLKLGEELENRRAKAAQRRTRVMLRDYLYGKKDNRRPAKQMHFCGCMRPKTTDDH